jgi:hypothetical protein
MQENDREFVEYVVKSIVGNPEAVQVSRRVDEMGVLLELSVDPADMGKIIGKDGRTAKAIRTLLRVLGAQNQSRVNLKIMEPAGGLRDTGMMADANEDMGNGSDEVAVESAPAVDMPETTSMEDLKDIEE